MDKFNLILPDERIDTVNEKITLIQKKSGLTFGTDAFLLSAFCRPAPGALCADLGCGTGVIALLLAARKTYGRIFGVEVQESFFEITRRNIENAALSDTVVPLLRDVRDLTPADFGRELDVVVANPPYMRADSGYASTERWIDEFCSSLFRILPWIYTENYRLTEGELALFKAAHDKDSPKFIKTVNELAQTPTHRKAPHSQNDQNTLGYLKCK